MKNGKQGGAGLNIFGFAGNDGAGGEGVAQSPIIYNTFFYDTRLLIVLSNTLLSHLMIS